MSSNQVIDLPVNALDKLKENGYKLTPQRTEILRILEEAGNPVSAQHVYTVLREAFPHISLDTVYRNLTLFTSVGLVSQINLQNPGSAMYEYQGNRHHHHAVCLSCGKSFCIETCPLMPQVRFPESEKGFRVLSHAFEVYGFCVACESKDGQ